MSWMNSESPIESGKNAIVQDVKPRETQRRQAYIVMFLYFNSSRNNITFVRTYG